MLESLGESTLEQRLSEECALFCRDVDSVLTPGETFEHLEGGGYYRLGTVEIEGDSGNEVGRLVVNKKGEERLVVIRHRRDTEVVFYTPAHDLSKWSEEGLGRLCRVRSLLTRAQFGGTSTSTGFEDSQGTG